MKIVTLSYTAPSNTGALKENAKSWIGTILSVPAVLELRMYQSPDGKDAMAVARVVSLAEMDEFLASEKFKTLLREMEAAGCSNFQLRPWEASPIMPDPIRREM
jgi:hypothetical protein